MPIIMGITPQRLESILTMVSGGSGRSVWSGRGLQRLEVGFLILIGLIRVNYTGNDQIKLNLEHANESDCVHKIRTTRCS